MNVVTLGGLVLGTGLLIRVLIVWWPGMDIFRKKDAARQVVSSLGELAPFLFAWSYGQLCIMCAGGIVGWIADATLWAGSLAGDGALVWGVGGEFGDSVTRGPGQLLTNGGHAVVLVLLFVFTAVLRRPKTNSGMMWAGWFSGVMTGLSTGVLGATAVPLASLVNVAGALLSTEVLT